MPNGSSRFIFLKSSATCLTPSEFKFNNCLTGIWLKRKPSTGERVTRIWLPSSLIDLKRGDLAISEPIKLILISAVLRLIWPGPSC